VRGSFHRDWGRRDSGVKLAHLKAVPKQECTMTPATYEERLLVDVLWSDPVNRPRGRPPSHIPQIMLQAFQGPMPLTIQPRAERRPFDYGPAFLGGGFTVGLVRRALPTRAFLKAKSTPSRGGGSSPASSWEPAAFFYSAGTPFGEDRTLFGEEI